MRAIAEDDEKALVAENRKIRYPYSAFARQGGIVRVEALMFCGYRDFLVDHSKRFSRGKSIDQRPGELRELC
jgi:hypothetical protein